MTPLKLSKSLVRRWLPPRGKNSHKGNYGHVLILSGSKGMSGASVLCSLGALRGGAGLVTAAVPESQQPVIAKKTTPETMTLALPETPKGSLSQKALSPVLKFIERREISAIALGPGLSREPDTGLLVRKLLERLNRMGLRELRGIVLDADGFLALGRNFFNKISLPVIVTPHPGEMAKFCGVSTSSVQKSRVPWAQKFARLNGVVCVLKGSGTVISDGAKTFLNPTGNPGMATGGSGDVLTGLIAALVPQLSGNGRILKAAAAGVFIHGLAGDLARKDKTEIGMIAGDIAEKIPAALKSLE